MATTTNGEVSLYFETFGANGNPVLLLVNGLGSQCINFKAEFCRMFADEGFRVVRYDNRDVGLAPAATNRDEAAERHLAGLTAWGSPAYFDTARITAEAHAAYDRCWDPEGRTRQAMAIASSPSRLEALRSLRVPTLVVHGDADRLVDPEAGQATADAIPGARLEVVPGMGHDYPPQSWPRLVELITAHAQSAASAQQASHT